MLDDDAGRAVELFYGFQRGISVGDVVVGQLFTVQLLCSGNGSFQWSAAIFNVEGRVLVWVLAVTQGLDFLELQVEGARELLVAAGNQATKIAGNGAVVGSGVFIGLDGQIKALLQ